MCFVCLERSYIMLYWWVGKCWNGWWYWIFLVEYSVWVLLIDFIVVVWVCVIKLGYLNSMGRVSDVVGWVCIVGMLEWKCGIGFGWKLYMIFFGLWKCIRLFDMI